MKPLFIIILIALILVGSISALTITVIGNGKWLVTFENSNKTAIVSNVNYDRQSLVLTADVNVSNGQGLTMQDLIEIKDYAQTANGATKKYAKTVLNLTQVN